MGAEKEPSFWNISKELNDPPAPANRMKLHNNLRIDATVKQKKHRRDLQTREMKVKPFTNIRPAGPDAAPQPQTTYSLANCDQYITPDCLRALYNFANGTLAV